MEIAFFPQPLEVNDDVISAQFVEVQGQSPEAESKLWETYDSKVKEFIKEKVYRFKEFEMNMLDIWNGVKHGSDKSSQHYTMNVMLQKMMGRDKSLSDDEYYNKYLEMKVEHLKKSIELHEECFKAYFKLERKKFNYGLKVRGINRTDIPESKRFTARTVLEFINALEGCKLNYDGNIRRMIINLGPKSSNIYIKQALELFIETVGKQKNIHLNEIEYYKELYTNLVDNVNVRVG